jgi:YD repeat-containing protein
VTSYLQSAIEQLRHIMSRGWKVTCEVWDMPHVRRLTLLSVITSSILFSSWGATQQVIFQGPCGTITRDDDGNIVRARQHSYNDMGLLDSRTETGSGDVLGVTRYTYGNDNQVIREEVFDDDNDLRSSVLYTYEAGQLVQRSERRGDRLERYITYVYDSAGRIGRELIYNRGDDLLQRNENIYDGEVLARKEIFDEDDDLIASVLYFYNERNDVTLSTRTDDDGDLVEEFEYTYDESGNLTTVRRRERGGDVLVTTYDYSCFQ